MSNYKTVDGYKIKDFTFYTYDYGKSVAPKYWVYLKKQYVDGIPFDNHVFKATMNLKEICAGRTKKVRIKLEDIKTKEIYWMTKRGFNKLLSQGIIFSNQITGHWTFNKLNGDLVIDFLDNKI